MIYKDRMFSAEHDSLTQDDRTVFLKLRGSLAGPANSRERIRKMESGDETVRLECRFSDPSGINYSTYWKCEWIMIDSNQTKTSDPVVSSPWRKADPEALSDNRLSDSIREILVVKKR